MELVDRNGTTDNMSTSPLPDKSIQIYRPRRSLKTTICISILVIILAAIVSAVVTHYLTKNAYLTATDTDKEAEKASSEGRGCVLFTVSCCYTCLLCFTLLLCVIFEIEERTEVEPQTVCHERRFSATSLTLCTFVRQNSISFRPTAEELRLPTALSPNTYEWIAKINLPYNGESLPDGAKCVVAC